jgi:hypothetical protein
MKKQVCILFTLISGMSVWAQTTIASWDFNSTVNDATPSTGVITPVSGAGTLSIIGGTTATYAAGNAADPNTTDNSGWNITTWPAQGINPKTAGIQIAVNTTGLQNINIEFLQRLSNTGANTWVLQYTLDNSVGVPVWTDAQTFTFVPAVTGTGDTWHTRTCNLSAVTGLNNNANVSFRWVSDFDPIAGQYLAAKSGSTYGTGGTSRFDMMKIESLPTVVPYVLNFVKADYTTGEAAGTAKVWLKVTTAGNTTGSIDLSISNWSNASATDYTVASVTIPVTDTLVVNDTIAFTINLNDDILAESDEYLICKLANGVNASFSATAQHTLYIRDNDRMAPTATNQLSLNLLGSFNNGAFATNSAEISAYDSTSKRIFIANSIGSKLDIVNFANPAAPSLISSIDITPYGAINSVAVRNGLVALAIENMPNRQDPGKVVFMNSAGTFISQVDVGVQPDMITFNHAGDKVYTANEGEPSDDYTNDPDGSVSIIDISGGAAGITAANVSHITFTSFNGQETVLRGQGIRIYGVAGIASKDFEPEYITISDDDSKAWVTLQENNAMAELNLTTNTVTQLIPLGTKNHNTVTNGMDASNQTSAVNLSNFPVKGMYLPDAISHYTMGGNVYLITANEGDTRAWTGLNEEARIGSGGYVLDPVLFPNAAELKNNSVLGRLNASNKLGDIDNDGDFDEIYTFGSRSFSIWNATTASLTYDSGDDFERITSTTPGFSSMFNASNGAGITVKDRSDDKGPEPEGVATGVINGKTYAFIALERIGGVMVYDITNPAMPVYVTYMNNRGPDRGSEGIIFIPAAESPNGKNLVILSNETSSTLSIYEIEACQAAGVANIANNSALNFCTGDSVKLFNINSDPSLTYQWFMNGQEINGETDSVYYANTSGAYELFAYNAMGCEDTSASMNVMTAPVPTTTVTTIGTTTFCAGDSVAFITGPLSGYTFQWLNNNAPIGGATTNAYTTTASGSYAVIVTNNGICSDTSAATAVTVNPSPAMPTINITGNGVVLDCPSTGVTFLWYMGPTPISGATASTYTATQNGSYAVEITDANGCTAISNTVAVNSVGLAKNNASIQSNLYPNPSAGSLNIELHTSSADVFTVEVYNLVGQKVDVIASKLNVTRHDSISYEFPAALNDGVYFIKIRTNAGETTKRVVLQR